MSVQGPTRSWTDKSESVRDFQNFVGPGPVRYLEILSVLVRSQVLKFVLVLVRSEWKPHLFLSVSADSKLLL